MFPHLKGFNLKQWIDENRGDWGQRRVIWQDSDFIAFVTRGPNRRKDFHINPGDEIFYQLEGDLNLYYIQDNKRELATLQAGDIFLLPKNTPHSPRRADGSWTYVVERQRGKERSELRVRLHPEIARNCEEHCVHRESPAKPKAGNERS